MKGNLLRISLLSGLALIAILGLIGFTFINNNHNTSETAYDVWLSEGNAGSEADFLDWLRRTSSRPIAESESEPKSEPEEDDLVEADEESIISTALEISEQAEPSVISAIPSPAQERIATVVYVHTAYETWLEQGNSGTESEFLDWVVAASGQGHRKPSTSKQEPSVFDNVQFNSISATYTGQEYEITAVGVPENAKIHYANNKATDVGTHRAFVFLTKDDEAKLMTATLTIQKASVKGATFADSTVVYDGTTKNIAVSGVPTGAKVAYTANGAPFKGAKDAGIYNITAVISGENYDPLTLTAKLTIQKANIENISLDDLAVAYDGSVKSLSVSGNLPAGVSAVYTSGGQPFAGATNVGIYEITATLSSKNHNTLTLTANLEIQKADIKGISFANLNLLEDGEAKTISVSGAIPAGVTVKYKSGDAPFNGATATGTYSVTAILSGSNYNTLTLNAKLTISKQKITGITFNSLSVQYDGTLKNILIEGEMPASASVAYRLGMWGSEFSGATEKGSYEIYAKITGPYHETQELKATLIITEQRLSKVEGLGLIANASSAMLSWQPVENAHHYLVNVYEGETLRVSLETAKNVTSYDLRSGILAYSYDNHETFYRNDYIVNIVAVPSSGNASFAPSEPSDAVIYSHAGVLYPPKNVRVENSTLKWDPVPGAGIYGVRIAFCDENGNIVRSISGNYKAGDGLEKTIELLKSDFTGQGTPLTPGLYRFAVRAIPTSPGSDTVPSLGHASEWSEYTEAVVVE